MKRILVTVEGITEEEFINNIVAPHLYNHGYSQVSARLLGNVRARDRRGGIRSWQTAKKDILRHIKQDRGALVGLMVDYYGLPTDWPGRLAAKTLPFEQRGPHIESELILDVKNDLDGNGNTDYLRFVPSIVMHEFEALLFSDCEKLASTVGLPISAQLNVILQQYGSPEMINDSPATAPSKRIISLVPGYQKPLYGNIIADNIGLPVMREKCPHFSNWITKLEAI